MGISHFNEMKIAYELLALQLDPNRWDGEDLSGGRRGRKGRREEASRAAALRKGRKGETTRKGRRRRGSREEAGHG